MKKETKTIKKSDVIKFSLIEKLDLKKDQYESMQAEKEKLTAEISKLEEAKEKAYKENKSELYLEISKEIERKREILSFNLKKEEEFNKSKVLRDDEYNEILNKALAVYDEVAQESMTVLTEKVEDALKTLKDYELNMGAIVKICNFMSYLTGNNVNMITLSSKFKRPAVMNKLEEIATAPGYIAEREEQNYKANASNYFKADYRYTEVDADINAEITEIKAHLINK